MGKSYYRLGEIESLRDEFSKVIDNFFGQKDEGVTEYDFIPPADVFENNDTIVVEIEIPGVEKKSIELNFENSSLSIKGIKKSGANSSNFKIHRIERIHGKFHRNIYIPFAIDSSRIEAELINGVLIIVLYKKTIVEDKTVKIEFKN